MSRVFRSAIGKLWALIFLPFAPCILGACASPLTVVEQGGQVISKASRQAPQGVWAVEIVDCDAKKCESQLLVIPPTEAASRSAQVFRIAADSIRGNAPFLKLPDALRCNLAAMSVSVDDLRRRYAPDGDVAIITVSTLEAFGIGRSMGMCSARLRVYQAEATVPVYEAEASINKTCPILWLMNYHELSGRLNGDGENAVSRVLSELVGRYARHRTSTSVPALASAAIRRPSQKLQAN